LVGYIRSCFAGHSFIVAADVTNCSAANSPCSKALPGTCCGRKSQLPPLLDLAALTKLGTERLSHPALGARQPPRSVLTLCVGHFYQTKTPQDSSYTIPRRMLTISSGRRRLRASLHSLRVAPLLKMVSAHANCHQVFDFQWEVLEPFPSLPLPLHLLEHPTSLASLFYFCEQYETRLI
jgi:hypothetical protein